MADLVVIAAVAVSMGAVMWAAKLLESVVEKP